MATVGPVAIAVDANANAFRVSVTQCIGYVSETFSAVTAVVTAIKWIVFILCMHIYSSTKVECLIPQAAPTPYSTMPCW